MHSYKLFYKRLTLAFALFILNGSLWAQLNRIIVETYYISDAVDAQDQTGGQLAVGSKTYRVFADLEPGSKITKIYGDQNHLLRFTSDKVFFNNADRGKTFAKDFNRSNYNENTVALDTWLTIGMLSKTHAGILKTDDTDGSFIGGKNNDGGSEQAINGLLTNSNSAMGLPLTQADGQYPISNVPSNWADYGFVQMPSAKDSSIFGSLIDLKEFKSNNAGLQNSGFVADKSNNNKVLLAQLTTAGELSFEINLVVINADGSQVKYVADKNVLLPGEKFSRHLKYPFDIVCGCPNTDFIEFKSDRDCDNLDSCKNLYVLGCTDTMACNYNPLATYHVKSMCCYPGYCNDRDLEVVCPDLEKNKKYPLRALLFPNPAGNILNVKVEFAIDQTASITVYDSFGNTLPHLNNILFSDFNIQELDLNKLSRGLYLIRVTRENQVFTSTFMKN